MLHESKGELPPTAEHGRRTPARLPPGQEGGIWTTGETVAATLKHRRRVSRHAAKAVLQRAWSRITHEHLAERASMDLRRFTDCLDFSSDAEPPLRLLLDVEQQEFEAAIVELRRERAARASKGGSR